MLMQEIQIDRRPVERFEPVSEWRCRFEGRLDKARDDECGALDAVLLDENAPAATEEMNWLIPRAYIPVWVLGQFARRGFSDAKHVVELGNFIVSWFQRPIVAVRKFVLRALISTRARKKLL